ncbi:MAG: ribose-phosphate pyrophosphokinase-like domain-containing protein, partial [Clostridiales bacterium]|nr:ribose-phosphate pyrophosphokinase-like domain-containing protein [Clostridiales bacterium]
MFSESTNPEFNGNLAIIALESCAELGKKIDESLIRARAKQGLPVPETYMIPIQEIRFSNGEGKIRLNDSVRGKDIYLLCDIGNYSCTYD